MPLEAERPRKCQKAPTFRVRRLLKPNVVATFRARRLLKPNVTATFRTRRLLKPNVFATFRVRRLLKPNVAATFRPRRLLKPNLTIRFRSRRLPRLNLTVRFRRRILALCPLPFALCAVRPVSSSGGVASLSAVLRYGGRFTSGTDYALMTGHYDGIPQLGDSLSLPYSFYFGSISSLLCLIVFCITRVRDRRLPPSQ
jgi:hypothetical protein